MNANQNKSPPHHTPGPWTIRDGSFIDAPTMLNIANVRGAHVAHEFESQANARLLAAAPELLEALAAVLADAKRRKYSLAGNITDAAHAAIVKAKGAV